VFIKNLERSEKAMHVKRIRDLRSIPAYLLLTGMAVFFSLLIAFPIFAEETVPEEIKQKGLFYTDQQGIRYELFDDGTCSVNGCTGDMQSTVRIPAQVSYEGMDYIVKGIDGSAFSACSRLKTIEIPDQVTDIPAGTFSACSRLKDIYIIPANAQVKKSGKNTVISVKISDAFKEEAGRVHLKADERAVQKAVSQKGTDTVTLFLSAPGAKSILLQEPAVKAIAGSGKDLKVRIKDTRGTSCYMKVSAENMKQADGALDLTLQEKQTGDTTGGLRTDLKKVLRKSSIRADQVKILEFSYGNGAKINTDVIVPAGDLSGVKAGSRVHIYRYEKDRRIFTEVSFHPYTVSNQGNLKVPLSKNSTFVISKTPFQCMVRKPANEFLTESGSTYYVGKDGKAVCGWKKIGSEYYYFDRENGKMSSGGKADGIKINRNGTAEQTEANVQKIRTMIKARAVVEQVTDASDSKSQKIEKCFRWIFQFPYRRYRRLQPIYRQPGWEVTFANDIFDKHQGCCVSEASAAAFLFHECGYETVYVACDTGHAWVELNGRVYDPLFAEARGFSRYYNVPYQGYGMRPVEKRKI